MSRLLYLRPCIHGFSDYESLRAIGRNVPSWYGDHKKPKYVAIQICKMKHAVCAYALGHHQGGMVLSKIDIRDGWWN